MDQFQPRFGDKGLLTAVVVDAADGTVRLVAFMDREALDQTRETGLAHFRSTESAHFSQDDLCPPILLRPATPAS